MRPLIERLEAAGAVLVGALNMGEYAYDFTGENVHDGPSRNPHDPTRMTGGSSGGSGGAVGGGTGADRARLRHQRLDPRAVVVLRHVRIEADLWPAVARAAAFRSSSSLDHLGPFARGAADLALAYDAMQGPDPTIRPAPTRPPSRRRRRWPRHRRPAHRAGRRLFPARALLPEALGASRQRRTRARRDARDRDCREAARARAAAYVITTTEGAALHLDRLRTRPDDFDPDVRDRLIAGAMMPAPLVVEAQKFRRWYRDAGAAAVQDGRRDPGAGDTVRRAEDRPEDVRAGRRGAAGAAEYRHLHAADFLHRPAGRRGPVPLRADADRRADHRARPGARTSRCASPASGAHGCRRGAAAVGSETWRSTFPT